MQTIHVSPDFPLNRRMRKAVRRGKLQVVREGGEESAGGGGEKGGLKCCQCPKPAIFMVAPDGEGGGALLLCLDCRIKYQNFLSQQGEEIERAYNMAADAGAVSGFPGIPKISPRAARAIQYGGATLNNIQVQNSNIGVLNTGTIGSVDNAIGVLKRDNLDLAKAIGRFAEQVVESGDLPNDAKNKILELLDVFSSEVSVTKQDGRKTFVVETLAKQLSELCKVSGTIREAWQNIQAFLGA